MNILFQPQNLKAGILILVGIGIGYVIRQVILQRRKDSVELEVKKIQLDAKEKAQELILKSKDKASEILEEVKKETKNKEIELSKLTERLSRREEVVDRKTEDLEKDKKDLEDKSQKIKAVEEKLKEKDQDYAKELSKIAGLSEQEAKNLLMKQAEKNYEGDILERMHKLELMGEERLERKAKDILATIIQRLASSTASEVTTTTVSLPSDDIKGKIIGKEGRNIRSLERASGVEIIVDETPGSIMISSFDSVRRQIARLALEELILDGRINPSRIEEFVEKSKNKIEKAMKDAADAAAYEVGVFDLDPRLSLLLGRLKFRTSYGQNVLQHSIEMAHMAGMLASELDGDVAIAKKGALLHDIGKAVDHEVQGTHVEIGRRILQKFDIDKAVIQAMQSHHEEYPYETLESVIVQTADAISASRPGARHDTLENYLNRLGDLERIATSIKGVEKCYAIQAGRELRIFVSPEEVSDLQAKKIAKEIADNIEKELKYPGEIKVMVIRENRVIEYAR